MKGRPGAGPAGTADRGGAALETLGNQESTPPVSKIQTAGDSTEQGLGGLKPPSRFTRVKSYLPRGRMLDQEAFAQRHRLLCWILGLHLPALFWFGLWQGFDVDHVALELQVPLVCLLAATMLRPGRLAAFFTTAGLVYCSAALVHLSGGMIEAHFHFFILVGFIALYQDWVPFLWNVGFVVLSHGLGSSMAADSMFNHYAAQNRPWLWASIHGASVLAACVGVVIFWRQTEAVQHRNFALRAQLSDAELAAAEAELTQRESVSAILVHLARRNQALLARQLSLIGDLEEREQRPEPMADLFRLDHLATRMRRNAESLLVLSGDDPPRRWGTPVPLEDVARAAAAEVEAYERVNVGVTQHLEVEGRAVADLTHMLAELLENAISFSPPHTEVRVNCYLAPGNSSGYVLSVEDTGVGLTDAELHTANQILADSPDVDRSWETLGLHVVSRLARRYDMEVRLGATPGQGVTAMVTLPAGLVRERSPETVSLTMAVSSTPPLPAPEPSPPQPPTPEVSPAPAPPSSEMPPPAMAEGAPRHHILNQIHEIHDIRRSFDAPRVDPADPNAWRMADPESAARMLLGAEPQPEIGFGQDHVGADEPHSHEDEQFAPGGEAHERPEPALDLPELTADGLVRRVPGRNLAEARRQMPGPNSPAEPEMDPGESRSSLSRFQASQRAGRAAADAEEAVGRDTEGGTVDGERGAQSDVHRGE